jgi:hydroxyacylglutathione hydrolase
MSSKQMEEVFPYLYRTEFQYLFYSGSKFKVQAFLLCRPEGNLLVYSSAKIEDYSEFIQSKGGLKATLITHVHEASKYCNIVAHKFKAPFYSPELEKDQTSRKCIVDKTYSGDHILDETLKIISTPGHTVGSSCFLWKSPDNKNILFTGDNLFPNPDKSWGVYYTDENHIPDIIKSLEKIKKLSVDIIVPTGYYDENLFYLEVTQSEWEEICQTAILNLK